MRAEAGIQLAVLDAATIADSRQELRLHPSTHKTGTIGGYIAGGSSGIGSITWGLLRDRGNILMARVVTMEAEPRILELCGADIQKVNHAYGTNGVITELELPLAPAYRWVELLVGLPDLGTAARCADAIAHEDAILKKLVSVIAAPVAADWLFPERLAAGEHALIVMVADFALDALHDALHAWPARIAHEGFVDDVVAPRAAPVRVHLEPHHPARAQARPHRHLPADAVPAAPPPRQGGRDGGQIRRRGADAPGVRALRR